MRNGLSIYLKPFPIQNADLTIFIISKGFGLNQVIVGVSPYDGSIFPSHQQPTFLIAYGIIDYQRTK